MLNIRFKKLLLFSIIGIILLSVSSVSAVSDLSPETSDVNDDLASTVDIYDSSSALQGDSIDLSNNQESGCNVLPTADSNGNVLATADDELIGNDFEDSELYSYFADNEFICIIFEEAKSKIVEKG